MFAFGQGLFGQLGTDSRELHLDRPHELNFPKITVESNEESKEMKPRITRIKANAHDSAAFDDQHRRLFTWGSFGNLRTELKGRGHKWLQFTPKLAEIQIMTGSAGRETYALTPDEQGDLTAPGTRNLQWEE